MAVLRTSALIATQASTVRAAVAQLPKAPNWGRAWGVEATDTKAGSLVVLWLDFTHPLGDFFARFFLRKKALHVIDELIKDVQAVAEELASRQVVVAAAIRQGDKILVAQRASPPKVAGKWELPGGKVEAGESEVDAVIRELTEELAITVRVCERLGPDIVLGRTMLLRAYWADLESGQPQALEHQAIRWITGAEIDDVDWMSSDEQLLPDLLRRLA